jgi:signal transduction histidine kinase
VAKIAAYRWSYFIFLSVGEMTRGNLGARLLCRYKNELRELAQDINQMAEALENEEQKKNEFLTNIYHDIRTPLTTIVGYSNMIKNKNYDSEEVLQGYIGIMERKVIMHLKNYLIIGYNSKIRGFVRWRLKNEKNIYKENFCYFYTFAYVHKFIWVYSSK